MDEASVLALLAGQFRHGPTDEKGAIRIANKAAVEILVWAKTDGLAEVYRKEREWKEQRENAAARENQCHVDDLRAIGPKPRRPICHNCLGTGKKAAGFTLDPVEPCPTCEGTGSTPPTYEEEHITSPSGMPK